MDEYFISSYILKKMGVKGTKILIAVVTPL